MTDIDAAAERLAKFQALTIRQRCRSRWALAYMDCAKEPSLVGDRETLADAYLALHPGLAELKAEIDAARETINRMGTIISNLEADAKLWDYVRRRALTIRFKGQTEWATNEAIDDLMQREPIE